jgi:hypothetical protein
VRQQEQPSSRLPEAVPRAQRQQQHQHHHPHCHHRLEGKEEAEEEVAVAEDTDLKAEEEVTMHLQEAPDQHSKGTLMA